MRPDLHARLPAVVKSCSIRPKTCPRYAQYQCRVTGVYVCGLCAPLFGRATLDAIPPHQPETKGLP